MFAASLSNQRASARNGGAAIAATRIATVVIAVVASFSCAMTMVIADTPDTSTPTGGSEIPSTGIQARIDTEGPGWVSLGESDFVRVNGDPDTFTFQNGLVICSGLPIGVNRTAKEYENFEFTIEWRHLKSAGNSGVFAWVPAEALTDLAPGKLPPGGIEIQMLDHGYAEAYEKRSGRPTDWFSTHGDVFAVGKSTMNPFPPLSPNGRRSFPSQNRSLGAGEWNHYYVRAINGEIRLWVNGEEVSGGSECEPRRGYLCLEAEGSPIEFRNIRIRELP